MLSRDVTEIIKKYSAPNTSKHDVKIMSILFNWCAHYTFPFVDVKLKMSDDGVKMIYSNNINPKDIIHPVMIHLLKTVVEKYPMWVADEIANKRIIVSGKTVDGYTVNVSLSAFPFLDKDRLSEYEQFFNSALNEILKSTNTGITLESVSFNVIPNRHQLKALDPGHPFYNACHRALVSIASHYFYLNSAADADNYKFSSDVAMIDNAIPCKYTVLIENNILLNETTKISDEKIRIGVECFNKYWLETHRNQDAMIIQKDNKIILAVTKGIANFKYITMEAKRIFSVMLKNAYVFNILYNHTHRKPKTMIE